MAKNDYSWLAAGGERVVLLTRPGCHLCEDARKSVQNVCEPLGERWVERNVDENADLVEQFNDEIPVVFVDGKQRAFWKVDESRLREALLARK